MKEFCMLISMVSAVIISQSALARPGGDHSGGGSGCLAEFMRTAYEFSEWLDLKGAQLHPPVRGNQFLLELDPKAIKFTDEDLRYQGNPVDAFWNGSHILVRCDRLIPNSFESRRKVVAHEIFRKMGLEGDHYEISRQIWSDKQFAPAAGVLYENPLSIRFSYVDGRQGTRNTVTVKGTIRWDTGSDFCIFVVGERSFHCPEVSGRLDEWKISVKYFYSSFSTAELTDYLQQTVSPSTERDSILEVIRHSSISHATLVVSEGFDFTYSIVNKGVDFYDSRDANSGRKVNISTDYQASPKKL